MYAWVVLMVVVLVIVQAFGVSRGSDDGHGL